MARFTVETDRRTQVVDITDRVRAALPETADGTATIFVRHTTAGVTVNEAESGLLEDIEAFLESSVDDRERRHDRIDDNADSHLRATLLGPSSTVPVTAGGLDLGTWQSVLFVECDGPRSRTVEVRV